MKGYAKDYTFLLIALVPILSIVLQILNASFVKDQQLVFASANIMSTCIVDIYSVRKIIGKSPRISLPEKIVIFFACIYTLWLVLLGCSFLVYKLQKF